MRFRLKALPHVFSGPYLNAFMHHKTDSYLLLVYGKCCKLHMYNSWGLLAPLNDENELMNFNLDAGRLNCYDVNCYDVSGLNNLFS